MFARQPKGRSAQGDSCRCKKRTTHSQILIYERITTFGCRTLSTLGLFQLVSEQEIVGEQGNLPWMQISIGRITGNHSCKDSETEETEVGNRNPGPLGWERNVKLSSSLISSKDSFKLFVRRIVIAHSFFQLTPWSLAPWKPLHGSFTVLEHWRSSTQTGHCNWHNTLGCSGDLSIIYSYTSMKWRCLQQDVLHAVSDQAMGMARQMWDITLCAATKTNFAMQGSQSWGVRLTAKGMPLNVSVYPTMMRYIIDHYKPCIASIQ